MTSHPSQRPVTALGARMIEDMSVPGFSEKTRNDYIRNVRAFAAFIGRSPDAATAEDLRRFQLHQTQTGMQPPSVNSAVSVLRFFFTVTLDRPDLARRLTVVRQPSRLPAVLSAEEVALLLQAAPGLKYKAALATAYGAGLRVSEVVALKVGDVDSERHRPASETPHNSGHLFDCDRNRRVRPLSGRWMRIEINYPDDVPNRLVEYRCDVPR
jgi:integrase/recombinase XerD